MADDTRCILTLEPSPEFLEIIDAVASDAFDGDRVQALAIILSLGVISACTLYGINIPGALLPLYRDITSTEPDASN